MSDISKEREELEKLSLYELRDIARINDIYSNKLISKEDFINSILNKNNNEQIDDINNKEAKRETSGILDIMQDGYGFLRTKNYEISVNEYNDIFVSPKQIKTYNLRKGDCVTCTTETRTSSLSKSLPAIDIIKVNDRSIQNALVRPYFDNLTPVYPNKRIKLESDKNKDFAIRAIDLIAPIGKGQRAMIVSPPKAGKTTLLKKIANSITNNYNDIKLMVLLVDERPEEVTDMQRNIKGEVIFSTFDETPEHHVKAAELVIERAKRLVEYGEDVIIIMDSLTRLARAYNLTVQPSGRTLSGGLDPASLYLPKKFFGAARNIEHGGSLTIIATALVDTGSRMDDVIYEEFKGTGNMEVHLDRALSEQRIFPAIDIRKSSTRRDDLLLDNQEKSTLDNIRRYLYISGDNLDAAKLLIDKLIKSKDNSEFMDSFSKSIMAKK